MNVVRYRPRPACCATLTPAHESVADFAPAYSSILTSTCFELTPSAADMHSAGKSVPGCYALVNNEGMPPSLRVRVYGG